MAIHKDAMQKSENKIYILSATLQDLTSQIKKYYGKGAYHANAIYRHVFRKGNTDFSCNPAFTKSGSFAESIEKDIILDIPEIILSEKDKDGSLKFVSRFSDGVCVESVIIPMTTYQTLCVSTQAGCRMGCRFCETGKMGLIRNLSASEIVGQVYSARFILNSDIKNIVFMGMGEPLDNFDNLVKAIEVLNEQNGLDFAHSRMTVSTAGLPEGIKKLGEKGWRRLNLAISLNAPDNEIRSRLMPVNRHASMEKLKAALMEYPLRPGGNFLVEYILIPGVNDLPEYAAQIAAFIGKIPVRLNLIPCNPSSSGEFKKPDDLQMHKFSELLVKQGIFVRKRWSKGSTLSAGCGQLGSSLMAS